MIGEAADNLIIEYLYNCGKDESRICFTSAQNISTYTDYKSVFRGAQIKLKQLTILNFQPQQVFRRERLKVSINSRCQHTVANKKDIAASRMSMRYVFYNTVCTMYCLRKGFA